jgi:nucleotide-binding universal stress UspA family protein
MSAVSRVIAGVSGSPRCLPALRYAAALARDHGAALIPLLVWTPPGGALADQRCPCSFLRQVWEADAHKRLEDAMLAALGGVPDGVPTSPAVVRGEAGWVLVHAASRPTDMLVIGTGRHAGVSRMARAQVSRYCLAHASCPVLAIPPSPLELDAGHTLHGWALRHRGLNDTELAALASGDSAGAKHHERGPQRYRPEPPRPWPPPRSA